MNGAEALVSTAISQGIEVCFANPGATEMPLVVALIQYPAFAASFACTRMWRPAKPTVMAGLAGKPAMCLLHLGPGLANGLANLHNARRAFTPVLNVIGQHATWHLPADPLSENPLPLPPTTPNSHRSLGIPAVGDMHSFAC